MNYLTSSLITMSNSWWSLPDSIQNKIKSLVPDKNEWSLTCTKKDSGDWVFSIPQFLTFNESLTGGTELIIDYYYEQVVGSVSQTGDKVKLVVSKYDMQGEQTLSLSWTDSDPLWTESNNYVDPSTGMVSWLCPYLQVLMKEVPSKLYVKVIPV